VMDVMAVMDVVDVMAVMDDYCDGCDGCGGCDGCDGCLLGERARKCVATQLRFKYPFRMHSFVARTGYLVFTPKPTGLSCEDASILSTVIFSGCRQRFFEFSLFVMF